MSAFFIIVPTLTNLAWPVIQVAVTSALAGLGYSLVSSKTQTKEAVSERVTVEVSVKNASVISERLGEEEELVMVKDNITLTFKKTIDGDCKVYVCATGRSEEELKQIGEEVTNRIIQEIVYNKVILELKQCGFSLIEEAKEQDGTIRLKVRKWR